MKKSQKQALAIGASAAAVAAAAAGVYLFSGKRGAKNRKKIGAFANKAKREVASELKKIKKLSKQSYSATVDQVMKRYKQAKRMNPDEIMAVANELKGSWNAIAKEVSKASKKVVKALPKKKAAKKKSAKKRR